MEHSNNNSKYIYIMEKMKYKISDQKHIIEEVINHMYDINDNMSIVERKCEKLLKENEQLSQNEQLSPNLLDLYKISDQKHIIKEVINYIDIIDDNRYILAEQCRKLKESQELSQNLLENLYKEIDKILQEKQVDVSSFLVKCFNKLVFIFIIYIINMHSICYV